MTEEHRQKAHRLFLFVAGFLVSAFVFSVLFLNTLAKERGWFAAYHHPVVIANGTPKTLWVSAASLIYPQNRNWAQDDFRLRADTKRLLPGERAVFKIPDSAYDAGDMFFIRAVNYWKTSFLEFDDKPVPEMAFKVICFNELQAFDGDQDIDFSTKMPDVVIMNEDLFPTVDLEKRLPALYMKPESREWPRKGCGSG